MSNATFSSPHPEIPNAAGSTRKNKKRTWRFLCYALGLFVAVLSFAPFCRTTGTEFSPIKFQTREFILYRIPGTNLQFLPTFLANPQSAAPSEILAKLRNLSQPELWHTVQSDAYGGDSFPARLLLEAINRRNTELDSYWSEWSQKNTDQAAVLWPIVQSMALANLYFEIPAVLRFAEGFQATDIPFEKALLYEVHRLVQQRKSLYQSNTQSNTGKPNQPLPPWEGMPPWSDVQAWLQLHPIPD